MRNLRKGGLSYRQIEKLVNVSKDSIRRWCVDVKLTGEQIRRLNLARKNGQILASKKGSEMNHKKSLERKEKLICRGRKEIKKLTNKEKFLVGVALYMAEGTKVGSSVEFTNSDPKVIIFMVDWLEKYIFIKRQSLKFSLWLHKGLSEERAIWYWSDLLRVSGGQFGKTYFAEVRKTRKSNFHEFGIIKIRYHNSNSLNLIKGWICGVFSG